MITGLGEPGRLPIHTWWFVLAVAILVLNDHVLKSMFAGTVHGIWTGKLSGIAGAVVFPGLLQWALVCWFRLSVLTATRVAVILGAMLMCGIETLPTFVDTVIAVNQLVLDASGLSHVFGPVRLVMDATDLVAVPFVAIIWFATLSRYSAASAGSHMETQSLPTALAKA